jgi:hypothetical protein
MQAMESETAEQGDFENPHGQAPTAELHRARLSIAEAGSRSLPREGESDRRFGVLVAHE